MDKKEEKNMPFEKSIYPRTLIFRDPSYEEDFRKFMEENRHLTFMFKFISYFIIAGIIVFRIATMISVCVSSFFKTASMEVEIITAILQGSSLLIEVILKSCNKLKCIQGIFLFTILRTTNISYCFYAQNDAIFPLPFATMLMVHLPASLALLNNWRTTAVSNAIVSVLFMINYLAMFCHNYTPLMHGLNIIVTLGSIN